MNNDHRDRARLSQKEADKIKIFSAACMMCVFLGVASIGLQIAAMVISGLLGHYVPYGFDDIGFGIWAGTFYFLAGCFGISTTFKRTKSRLMGTVVTSAFSIGASIVAATLSGMAASYGYIPTCYSTEYEKLCDPWLGLEWCLMAISVLASMSSIIVIIMASEVVCCSNYGINNSVINQQEVNVGIRNTQQKVYINPPPMQLNAQQLPTFQVSYVPQVIQSLPQPQHQQVTVAGPATGQATGPAMGPATGPVMAPTLQQVQH